jgi:hydroxymethylglutaryl-CoA lyase
VKFPERITLVEVGPRDGLQSLDVTYTTETKLELISLLARTGIPKIEVTAFVRPDVIPQLADAEELMRRLHREPGCTYRALAPNRRGAERAAAAGVDEILGLITASETYNKRNSNMSISENLDAAAAMAEVARTACAAFVMAIGSAMFCVYEGEVPQERVLSLIERMRADGINAFYVATSAGLDGPRKVYSLCARILDRWPDVELGLHLHNTNGMALANVLAGLDAGVTVFEGSICGIGGGMWMPREIPHHGNVATEDIAHMLAEMEIATGIDLKQLLIAAGRAAELLDLQSTSSFALRGGTKDGVRAQIEGHHDPH